MTWENQEALVATKMKQIKKSVIYKEDTKYHDHFWLPIYYM